MIEEGSGGKKARRIGVAVSGGGHRAATWGFGAMLALVDSGVNGDVVSVASVSGGSIANGVVAQRLDYTRTDRTQFESAIAPALRSIAFDGLFFFGPSTNGYIAWLFAAIGLALGALIGLVASAVMAGRATALWWTLLVGPVVATLLGAVWLRKSKLPGPFTALMYAVAVLIPSLFCLGGVALVRGRHGGDLAWRLTVVALVAVAVFWLALRTFARRSQVVDDGLAQVHYPGGGAPPTLLRDVDRTAHHLFCATELQAGDHVYFSPRMVYSYRAGRGIPGEMKLSTAVQSSSCFPGGMLPRELDTAGFALQRPWQVEDGMPPGIPSTLVVNDGGVYDNMADQWEQGFDDRAKRIPDLHQLQAPATHLVVVNAGKALGWGAMGRTGALTREVRALTRTVSVLYDVTTSHRRQGMVRRFRDTETQASGLDGALVHIAQSPFDIPRAFGDSPDPDQRVRAAQAMTTLQQLGADESTWARRAGDNSRVKTTLRALGTTTVDLLEHGYWLATINLYVIFGWGSLTEVSRFKRDRFERLSGYQVVPGPDPVAAGGQG